MAPRFTSPDLSNLFDDPEENEDMDSVDQEEDDWFDDYLDEGNVWEDEELECYDDEESIFNDELEQLGEDY